MTRSTRSVVRSGSRDGVGAQVKLTRFSRPNANRANQRAISTSKPAFWPLTLMYPNGGASHFTPTRNRFRALMFAGSRGRVAAAADGAAAFAGDAAFVGDARLQAANAAARNTATPAAPMSRLIQLLLLRW